MKDWTAKEIMETSGAFWRSRALQAGVQLDLFTVLDAKQSAAPEGESITALAKELSCDERALAMLITALTAAGFLIREGDMVRAAQSALTYLSRRSDEYLGFIIAHHANLMPGWAKLDTAVRTGKSTSMVNASATKSEAEREAFLMGMFNIARLQADIIAKALDLSGKKRLIDIGGGPGTYAVYFCKENPELEAAIFDLPTTGPFAEKIVATHDLSGRIAFHPGNFRNDELPSGFDVAWLSQVLHGESPEGAQALVAKAARALAPGGMICIQEFVLDDDGTGPEHAALFSLNMLVQTEGGQAYTESALRSMLTHAGARHVAELAVRLPQNCRVFIGQM